MQPLWLTKAQFREVARICCPTMSLREFNIAWAERGLMRADTKDWEAHQERQQRRDSEKTQPVQVRHLYPTPKKDRREPRERTK